MIELSRQNIVAVMPSTIAGHVDSRIEVGLMRVYRREGDGGTFRKAYLYENFETVLEDAARLEMAVRLEFCE